MERPVGVLLSPNLLHEMEPDPDELLNRKIGSSAILPPPFARADDGSGRDSGGGETPDERAERLRRELERIDEEIKKNRPKR